MTRILVINPNSSAGVTEGLRDALAGFSGATFDCIDIPEGPATIMTEEDVSRAGLHVAERIKADPGADAYVIACFSDPGLDLARSLTAKPVIGIQEAGILTALARADRFGIIALGPKSIPRHMRKMRAMGVLGRLAGELDLGGVGAEEAGRSDAVFARTLEIGERLRDMGAGALVPGCAGFAPRRAALERALGIAVIDPVQAACAMALGAVQP
ncbi:aspartate/glutamate racemase family protein [Roseicyclus marinus]|uniref:aspartate/glutamate racemase family protein n=1 Tax=Roseicyclus marinus TaxID=2161673 RepID=UPI00240F9489|nr:aspartate/glutamate racemase family protein [Roseicyclus marinus]MDG3040230.1 aspartate/glutamate racemase family protein [Roseicyclus marinus]